MSQFFISKNLNDFGESIPFTQFLKLRRIVQKISIGKPEKGLVKWARNVRVKTSCEMNIVNFPYDSQACPITISSQDNSNEYLKLSTRKWNKLNNVNENETSVIPNDIDTVKVSFLTIFVRNKREITLGPILFRLKGLDTRGLFI